MFQFPRFPSPRLWIQRGDDAGDLRPDAGFPHSDIPGSKPAHGSPGLIAVFHVLHRHLTPRHPPYALSSLTCRDAEKLTFFMVAIQLLRFSSCGGLTRRRRLGRRAVVPSSPGLGTTARRSTDLYSVRPGNSAGPSGVGAAAPRTARGKMPAKSIRLRFPATCRSPRAPSTQRPGGDEGTRTPDFRLAKAALSQLSYIPAPLSSTFSDAQGASHHDPLLWAFQDSNLGPFPYQRNALTN